MKNIFFVSCLFLGISLNVSAQDSNQTMNVNGDSNLVLKLNSITLEEFQLNQSKNLDKKNISGLFNYQSARNSRIQIEDFNFNGVSVLLEGKQKSIEKAWKQYLRNTSNVKIKEKKGKNFLNRKKVNYWKATEIKLLNVTNLSGDILTIFEREEGYVKMTVVYKLGYNTSINEYNFQAENEHLKEFINTFSQLNFQEYYGDHIKHLKHTLKMVDKELTKESRELKRLEKSYNRSYTKKGKSDELVKFNIDVQRKLTETLRVEKNQYYLFLLHYKEKNSNIRIDKINSTFTL